MLWIHKIPKKLNLLVGSDQLKTVNKNGNRIVTFICHFWKFHMCLWNPASRRGNCDRLLRRWGSKAGMGSGSPVGGRLLILEQKQRCSDETMIPFPTHLDWWWQKYHQKNNGKYNNTYIYMFFCCQFPKTMHPKKKKTYKKPYQHLPKGAV